MAMKENRPRALLSVSLAWVLFMAPAATEAATCPELFSEAATSREVVAETIENLSAPRSPLNSEGLRFPPAPSNIGLEVLAVVPTNELAFKRVFGQDRVFSAAAEREALETKAALEKIAPGATILEKPQSTPFSIERFIEKSSQDFVVLLGHNENGMFRLPGNESRLEAPLISIAETAQRHGKVPIFLSCRSREFLPETVPGVSSEITFAQATRIAEQLKLYLDASGAQGKPLRIEKVAAELAEVVLDFEVSAGRSLRVEAIVKTVGGVSVVVALAIVAECLSDPECL